MIKLLITDVDGTLLQKGEAAVGENIKKKLRAFIASGGTVAIASGRTYRSLSLLFGDLAENVYFIPGYELMDGIADDEGCVDMTHPTDLGFYAMAKRLAPELEKIFAKF